MPKASTGGRNGALQKAGALHKFPGLAAYLKCATHQERREDQEMAKKYPRPLYGMHREEDMNIPISDIRFDKHPKSNHLVYFERQRQDSLPVVEKNISVRDPPPAKNRHINKTAAVVAPQPRRRSAHATPQVPVQPQVTNVLQSSFRSPKSPKVAESQSANPRTAEKRKAQEMDDAAQPIPATKRSRQTQPKVPQVTAHAERPAEEMEVDGAVALQTGNTATEQIAKETASSPRVDSAEPKPTSAEEPQQRLKTPTETGSAGDVVQPEKTRPATGEPVSSAEPEPMAAAASQQRLMIPIKAESAGEAVQLEETRAATESEKKGAELKKGSGMYRGPWYYEDAANTSRKTWEDEIHDAAIEAAKAAAEGAVQGRSMRTRKPVERPQTMTTRRKRKADSSEADESRKKVRETSKALSVD
ncbi:hypothetical protein K490DRAFT_52583 [Saccharata proteae CBS 121410]|uniref:Uncharacterized protein n=1 Tax=Saccharata proteae CBS 121410 TaxID=1314787 RepID=A0A9P4I1B2_9PEZI|nr:hypothetical protein K490DRAFT_52583 [Saccharata proteae CBS 121410]